jgi:hypothetical protein
MVCDNSFLFPGLIYLYCEDGEEIRRIKGSG